MQKNEINGIDASTNLVVLVGKNVAKLRSDVGWSTRAFSQHTGMSLGFLYRIEHGKHKTLSVDTLERIARGFGVEVSVLVANLEHKKALFSNISTRQLVALSLVELRAACDWTQDELARQSGINRSVIADIEREGRNVSLSTLERLSNSFGVEVQTFFVRC